MNLHFPKSVVKATAAVCIAALLVACACLAVFAVQSNTSQDSITVDDSAHTVDVSRDYTVRADTFRSLYPEFTVLDSHGEIAGASEPLRFCTLTKDGITYTVTGVPTNYSQVCWAMDTISYPGVWGLYNTTTPTLTVEKNIYGKADNALKIAGSSVFEGLNCWGGDGL